MYSKDEWVELANVLRDHPNVVILLDDIYNRLVFNERGLAPHLLEVAPELKDRVIIVNGASKTYSMTGWRVGWAVGPEKVISAMNKYQSQSVSCASPFSLAAVTQAINEGQKELDEAVSKLKTRRDFIYSELSKVEGIQVSAPDGAFYIWPNVKSLLGKSFKGEKLKTTREFCKALLEDQMVVTVPGIEFGLDGFLRISYALEQPRMQEAVNRIKAFVQSLD